MTRTGVNRVNHGSLKGIIHPKKKKKVCHHLLICTSFQTCTTDFLQQWITMEISERTFCPLTMI